MRQKADATLTHIIGTNPPPLWQASIALKLGDMEQAQKTFIALSQQKDLAANIQGMVSYYLGLIALEQEQFEQAEARFNQLKQLKIAPYQHQKNIQALNHRQVLTARKAGHFEQAMFWLNTLPKVDPGLSRQLNQEVAYTLALKDNWAEALSHWQKAEELGEDSRKLDINLALAYQKTELFYEAAERWRKVLRRRPRKADHPDALSDEQVSKLWQTVANNYAQAGDHEEAIKTYKNALKWNDSNLEIRLALVDALQVEGRWQAAENELNRILDKDPDNIKALILLAESHNDDYSPHRAKELWLRVLELEPNNPIAKQQFPWLIANYIGSRGWWLEVDERLNMVQEGLDIIPDSQILLILAGDISLDMPDLAQAKQYFNQAINLYPNDVQVHFGVMMTWLHHEKEKEFEQVLDRLFTLKPTPAVELFLQMAERFDYLGYSDYVIPLLQRVKTLYPNSTDLAIEIAWYYYDNDQNKEALVELRSALKINPHHAEANLRIGIIYYEMGQTRLGRKHWQTAEKQAKLDKNGPLLLEIQTTKDLYIHGRRQPSSPLEMLNRLSPEMLDMMADSMPPELLDLLKNAPPGFLESLMDIELMDEDDFYD